MSLKDFRCPFKKCKFSSNSLIRILEHLEEYHNFKKGKMKYNKMELKK
jgi:hypothetical protein